MSLLKTILIVLVVLILLIWIINLLTKDSKTLTSLADATVTQKIEASSLPSDSTGSNYTYSMWFYVQDWNSRYGEKKIILKRGPGAPSVELGAAENNLHVNITCYNSSGGGQIIFPCDVKNVPLQKWVNVIISLYGRSLDIYIDGKLVKTCVLPGPAKTFTNQPIYVTPDGGFSGSTSNIRFWTTAKNPQEAYNIYKQGYGGSLLGNLFNKYRIKVAFLEDNKETATFKI